MGSRSGQTNPCSSGCSQPAPAAAAAAQPAVATAAPAGLLLCPVQPKASLGTLAGSAGTKRQGLALPEPPGGNFKQNHAKIRMDPMVLAGMSSPSCSQLPPPALTVVPEPPPAGFCVPAGGCSHSEHTSSGVAAASAFSARCDPAPSRNLHTLALPQPAWAALGARPGVSVLASIQNKQHMSKGSV